MMNDLHIIRGSVSEIRPRLKGLWEESRNKDLEVQIRSLSIVGVRQRLMLNSAHIMTYTLSSVASHTAGCIFFKAILKIVGEML